MPKSCWSCGEAWSEKRSPGFREECLRCREPLHCCRNCRFYDAAAQQWCREPQARDERPVDPAEANTCDYFLFGEAEERKAAAERERKARAELAAAVGEAPKPPARGEKEDWMKHETEEKPSLDDLFKKE
jgi:hypothetical protein